MAAENQGKPLEEADAGALALDITRVTTSPLDEERMLVQLEGRWPGRPRRSAGFAALVVEVNGRSNRFPVVVRPPKASFVRRTVWSAGFALPTALAPHLAGSAMLVIGGETIPLPRPQTLCHQLDSTPPPAPIVPAGVPSPPRSDMTTNEWPTDQSDSAEPDVNGLVAQADEDAMPPAGASSDDVLTGETAVQALRAELDARAASEAQLRARLADVQAQLGARTSTQERLEAVHAELREELEGLRGLVVKGEEERARAVAEMRAEMTSTVVSRDAAMSEATALRSELERLSGQLAQAREQIGLRESGLDEAERLLAEARALSASLRND